MTHSYKLNNFKGIEVLSSQYTSLVSGGLNSIELTGPPAFVDDPKFNQPTNPKRKKKKVIPNV
ncbi:hypothetical protein [Aliiglaciecola sp. LCG003]|uniref:hypothetical protein n=1 Tax=Aliiglaciecola sp. LCG003 TaxID=3053655 RepID=UPI0025726242|nr:hypothetical protein [Aliiglaciecola sp. LCG003]WJG09877.1 hypothetical protein QR722_02245 [Aliiglaciecola sp. LCG003]